MYTEGFEQNIAHVGNAKMESSKSCAHHLLATLVKIIITSHCIQYNVQRDNSRITYYDNYYTYYIGNINGIIYYAHIICCAGATVCRLDDFSVFFIEPFFTGIYLKVDFWELIYFQCSVKIL